MVGDSIFMSIFNHDGSIFTYAVSYDWLKGHFGEMLESKNNLVLHMCKDEEVKKQLKK